MTRGVKCFLVEPIMPIGIKSRWIRRDTGEVRDKPYLFGSGAMWFITWFKVHGEERYGYDWNNQFTPPLCVMTPGGVWNIDARGDNCKKPADFLHRCWVRHGEVPNITVDKHGNTCSAGEGSIRVGLYHGFLINGELIPC